MFGQYHRSSVPQKTVSDKQAMYSLFRIFTLCEQLTMDCFHLTRELCDSLQAVKETNQKSHYKHHFSELFANYGDKQLKKVKQCVLNH